MQVTDPLTRRVFLGGAAVGAAALLGPRATAAPSEAEARRAINLAGRQRMLSQRMARATFFTRLGIEPSRHLEMVAAASALFDETLAGLENGSDPLGLATEASPRMLEGIAGVKDVWEVMQPATVEIAETGAVSDASFETIAANNVSLLFTSDNVVDQLVSVHGTRTGNQGLAAAINIAGRQRMLSQKMAKEAALIGLGLGVTENPRNLRDSALLFDQSLTVLIEGEDRLGIPAAPDFIRIKLLEVRSIWGGYGEIMQGIVAGAEVDRLAQISIAAQADPLLVTMNEAVGLYEVV
ncbi:MAG: type IV pili methyl-accepting chemotaxis transducer N-terminal domain-containing protein [Paracoccaceae bacterium]